jgi:CelD/BcsL family acetyltransferase involved in cellulose biosynthesis
MLNRTPLGQDTTYQVSVADSIAGIPAEWPSAARESEGVCHVFQTREFIDIWCRTYAAARNARPLLVTVLAADGSLLLMLPLVLQREGYTRVLGFMDSGVADYNAPVLFPTSRIWTAEAAGDLWSAIEKALPAYDVARLEKMPAYLGNLQNPLALIADGANEESCHGNVLTRPWSEVEATQPYLKTLKKSMRGMQKLGTMEFVVAETEADRQRFFDVMIRQKQRRFEETQVPGFDAEPYKLAFFQQANEAFAKAGALHVSALKIGDEIIATAWGLTRETRLYDLLIGFEAGEWSRFSPGRALNLMLLKWLHDRGYTYLDHGIGNEAWKLESCEATVPLYRRTIIRTPIGRIFALQTEALSRMRATRTWQKIRPLKWIVLRAFSQRRARG